MTISQRKRLLIDIALSAKSAENPSATGLDQGSPSAGERAARVCGRSCRPRRKDRQQNPGHRKGKATTTTANRPHRGEGTTTRCPPALAWTLGSTAHPREPRHPGSRRSEGAPGDPRRHRRRSAGPPRRGCSPRRANPSGRRRSTSIMSASEGRIDPRHRRRHPRPTQNRPDPRSSAPRHSKAGQAPRATGGRPRGAPRASQTTLRSPGRRNAAASCSRTKP
jgi:hypothetical protein